jgi:DNA transformation protein and related proteins
LAPYRARLLEQKAVSAYDFLLYHSFTSMSAPVESLPNIGPELSLELRKVGITTADELLEVGAIDAWQRLVRAGLRDCMHSLLALEGAVEGIASEEVPIERQQELKQFAIAFSQGN